MPVTTKKTLDVAATNLRLNALFCFFALSFLLVNLKLFQTQVLSHEKYQSEALGQYLVSQELPAKRGDILSRENYILAGTQMNYLMYLEPNIVVNKSEVAEKLAGTMSEINYQLAVDEQKKLLTNQDHDQDEDDPTITADKKIDKEQIYQDVYQKYFQALNKDLMWVAVERNLNPLNKEILANLKLPGVGFEEEPKRYYPECTLASHILGFVASDEQGNKTGYYGIEGYLNADLNGKPGRIVEEKDARGTPILMGGYKKVDPVSGRTIVLTISRPVQYIVERLIKEGVETYDSVSGTVIVMNPSTGEIIALANYPTYDPQNIQDTDSYLSKSPFRKEVEKRNNAVAQTYEPGSVIKPLTIASAIDLHIITPESTFTDAGPVSYSGHIIDNWDGKHYGVQTITELLQKSNNIGAAWVGTKLGPKNLYNYFQKFGVGTKTGVSLEGEDSGILGDYTEWVDINVANVSFGQGMSVTPLQLLNAINVFANGGFLLQPKIISAVQDGDKTIEMPTKTVRRVISKDTADQMVSLLESAAAGGEAKWFVLKNYRIAGKTGTAQIPEGGKYSPDRFNATFVGFLAGSDSANTFSLLVRLEEPHNRFYASEAAAPVWMKIFSELVKYYGIAPNKVSTATQ